MLIKDKFLHNNRENSDIFIHYHSNYILQRIQYLWKECIHCIKWEIVSLLLITLYCSYELRSKILNSNNFKWNFFTSHLNISFLFNKKCFELVKMKYFICIILNTKFLLQNCAILCNCCLQYRNTMSVIHS